MGTEKMSMKEYVTSLLEGYNDMKREIEALRFELKNLKFEDDSEMIEEMNYSSPNKEYISGGGISDKTPNIALTYAQKFELLRQQATCEINVRLLWLTAETERLDFYIDKLEAHQATVLREYYFDGYSWREIAQLKKVSPTTLMKYRDTAIQRLAENYDTLDKVGLIHFWDKIS